jgi:hypothetical protein
MVYQLETAIARRTLLKRAGLVALYSVAVPLKSLGNVVQSPEAEQRLGAECPV